ncbi:DUF3986 family protein [Bacillus weihaiensis]|uniref:DUF3986 domain-containing protein n=1 Tax=Bacillus weihaiensis TaxID=1547283 RepID=A0A1L3MRC9_9BACI|nr:DUF3986 family protein [Bacillus weihaiensis]APH04814.1 hypothetical protein A9C19_08680 [Bacillus weihaiensis]
MIYDDKYHLHIGYYEDGFDLEAVAFKRQSQDIWDIFFDFEQYDFNNTVSKTELKGVGYHIFSIETEDLDYQDGALVFEQWLLNQRLVRI